MIKSTYFSYRKRSKEKYEKSGMDGWHDYEVFELLL
jgi:DNA repair protein RadC